MKTESAKTYATCQRVLIGLAVLAAGNAEAVCYVDRAATGRNDGSSWNDAYTDLQSALKSTRCTETWTARGVYKPDSTDSTVSFTILPGVSLYGGFDGTETSRDARNVEKNITVLSGDIDDNDGHSGDSEIDTAASDIVGVNSETVVWVEGTLGARVTSTTVIDGFTITGGSSDSIGAGLFCHGEGAGSECSPTLSNLVFSGNAAQSGGAIYNDGYNLGISSPLIDHVRFVGNYADENGGAVYNEGFSGGVSSPAFSAAVFQENVAAGDGGAIYLGADVSGVSGGSVVDSLFVYNSAGGIGGAIDLDPEDAGSSSFSISRSTFVHNTAMAGGAIAGRPNDSNGSLSVTNSTFTENLGQSAGGALYWEKMSYSGFGAVEATINNTTFTGNASPGFGFGEGAGGAIYIAAVPPSGGNPRLTVRNSIFWKDVATTPGISDEVATSSADVVIEHSDVQDGCPIDVSCADILNADPMLGVLGGYFGVTPVMRPSVLSPVIDAGHDATCEATDQRNIARPQRLHCDIGAVELRFPSDDLKYPPGF